MLTNNCKQINKYYYPAIYILSFRPCWYPCKMLALRVILAEVDVVSKLNTTEQYEIYNHFKQSPANILNDQIHCKSHTLLDTIKHSSHNNISSMPTTTNRNIAASSTGTVKH